MRNTKAVFLTPLLNITPKRDAYIARIYQLSQIFLKKALHCTGFMNLMKKQNKLGFYSFPCNYIFKYFRFILTDNFNYLTYLKPYLNQLV